MYGNNLERQVFRDIVVISALVMALMIFNPLTFLSKTLVSLTPPGHELQIKADVVLAEPVYKTLPSFTPEPEFMSLGEYVLTAYCPCVKCCEVWSDRHPSRVGTKYTQKTASGTVPVANRTIAVCPSAIPLGTTVFINGQMYVAEDKGGAIKGKRIDIFFDTHSEALNFGRQKAEVYIKI